ncbi:type II toxin-antitoxin system CcdA family antitoxin [Rhizobium sp. KVB221]|uniref:Type II toxin-antitoxin system CcdA family antitoxin n=1 Tax=Rhizobium setariae TaxID=2801340 RepID=A0A936YRU6_9HYPH|nr:type II toxin-antitoxin system CcdA family antitoxin [Rhizobium setariae]MBL0371205.1 type II toxin-antitoxin system CcdA family antitoxin [Rhizobium setariae]
MALERKPANLSIDSGLLEEAKQLKINISRAAEQGVLDAVRKERERVWKLENAEAIASLNEHFEKEGLPFPEYRGF